MNHDVENICLTMFETVFSKKGRKITLKESLDRIINGNSKEIIHKVRASINKEEKADFKKLLPAITYGAYCKSRTNISTPSGLACLDYDNVNSITHLAKELKKSKHILSFWVSPSGNGLKALVRIPLVKSKEIYKQYYLGILKEFKCLDPDPSTKDMNRLCYESYDPNLYFNPNAEVFKNKVEFKKTTNSFNYKNIDLPEGKKIDIIINWWMKNHGFSEGQRNNNLFVLACSLSEFGINQETTSNLFESFISSDFKWSEIQTIIKSAYKKTQFNSKSFGL